MYDQFLAKTFHTPSFGDDQSDANSQNNNNSSGQGQRQSAERVRGMTPSSDSSNERQQTPSHRHGTPVSTGMTAAASESASVVSRHAPAGYPSNFLASPLSHEQLYNARLSYSQHLNYQQYRQQLMHQMGAYNPLEMLQQGYGMGPPAAPPQLPPPVQPAAPEPPVNEDSDDSAAQTQMYTGMKRPSPDNCFLNVQKKPKPQKKKKKRDPNEPQKPVSAYALFFRDTQAAIKGQNPNASFGEVSKIVASMWDTLDVEHKNVYKRKTEDAKKDYLKALAAYRASLVSKSGRETETNTSYNSGYAAGGCFNGYSQHGYSPPTSAPGGGAEHLGSNQRVAHHHQGYSPPPGSMPAKIDHAAPAIHHHGYSQTPGGNVMSDSRGTQLGHPFNQNTGNQNTGGMDHMAGGHRVSHHHHGYSPTSGQSQQESAHSKNQQHNAYSSPPGSASTPGAFSDNHSSSQDRNSQLGTHYHGYSPPRSIAAESTHQMGAQYVTSSHSRHPTSSASHQGYQNPGTGNIGESVQNKSQQNSSGYPTPVGEGHQGNIRGVSHHHTGYTQLSNASSQVDNRTGNASQQATQTHMGYSSSPGGGSQQETHQAASQTGGYQTPSQSGETHHHLGSQSVSNAYTQSSGSEHQHHASTQSTGYSPTPPGDSLHQQHGSNQGGGYSASPGGESHHQHHASSQNVQGQYPPTSTSGDTHHQHMSAGHRLPHPHQSFSSSRTSPFNGYSPRLSSSFDAFSPSNGAPAASGPSLMNQDCIQNQQQQSQVLVGRHMAPGGQHMTVHQPPPI